MSDLSLPPLSLLPLSVDEPLGLRTAAGQEHFAWPTPPLPCYPGPARQTAPEACDIEGLNGQTTSGRMLSFRPTEGVVLIQLTAGRAAMPLRFAQFRCLRLATPLPCAPTVATAIESALPGGLGDRPAVPYLVRMNAGSPLQGLTVRHHETEYGLFLFEPVDHAGNVRRMFVPRAAYERAEIGQRIGDALVEQQVATAGQVQAALEEQQTLRTQKLGDILIERQIISPDELLQAIDQQSKMPMVRIGEALVALGMVSAKKIEDALAHQRNNRSLPLGELLVRRGVVSRDDLQTALSRKMGYPLVDVAQFPPEAEAVARIPYSVARRVPALALLRRGGRLVVAMEDPTRKTAVEEVEFAAQGKIVPVLARVGTLQAAVDRAYQQGSGFGNGDFASATAIDPDAEDASKLVASLELANETAEGSANDELTIEQSDNSLVRLLNQMILEAQAQGASDIHIECSPGREKVKIRFRKDGQMRPYLELPHTHRSALIARLKIMCELDISEKRKPQDGKITFSKFVQGSKLELRVATIPTHSGMEDAVLRLLASAKAIPLDNLNLSPNNLHWIKTAMQRPYGMILCVGPTGSGKTTTLHSAVGFINSPERKIWTAEDPIEITQPGLRQVQVNPKIDWTFAKALRAFLRADPDVVMVGEIRDQETAQIAVEASLTGHLVLSTLHTNSAPETVTRLVDMGLDPFNFADSLLAIIAQRLVRKLCHQCREPRTASPEELEELLRDYVHVFKGDASAPQPEELLLSWRERFGVEQGRITTYRAVGCPRCDNTGFRGRAGIHELLTVSHSLRHLIQTNARSDELLRGALAEGMRTLRQDGIEKVLAGITTIEEVRANSN